MHKFTDSPKDQELLIDYLTLSSNLMPHQFILNSIWLAKGPYFYEQSPDKNFLSIYKQSKIYGKEIFYHVGLPLCQSGSLEDVKVEFCRIFHEKKVDFLLSDHQIQLLDMGFDINSMKPEYHEYVYSLATYGDLKGGEWQSWRQSLAKTQSLMDVKYYHSSSPFPFYLQSHLQSILTKWKEHREKYIGKHSDWYINNFKVMKNCLVTVYYLEGKPISFNISQLVGNQIFFLDEKTLRHVLPNSFTISKAYHILCFRWWQNLSHRDDLIMSSGLGEKEYKHGEKTFDLDKHKDLLKPIRHFNLYKLRANKND